MSIILAEEKLGTSGFGDVYKDNRGLFFIVERTIQEIVEANVTNGRGYIPRSFFDVPFAESPLKEKINPEIYCYRRLRLDKFPSWKQDVKEGHPEYSKLYHKTISL